MAYNMGPEGFGEFSRFMSSLREGLWEQAMKEFQLAQDGVNESNYWKQHGENRAKENLKILHGLIPQGNRKGLDEYLIDFEG